MKIRKIYYKTVSNIFTNRLNFESLYPTLLKDLNSLEKNRLINLVNIFFRNFPVAENILIERIDKKIDEQGFTTSMLLIAATVEYLYLDKAVGYAIVNDYVDVAKQTLGTAKSKYINAILRKVVELNKEDFDSKDDKYLYLTHPKWIIDRFKRFLGGEQTRQILEFNLTSPSIFLRPNKTKVKNTEALIDILKDEGVITKKAKIFKTYLKVVQGNVISTKSLIKGLFYIQEPSHSIPILLLAPRKNDKILDLCCAPGGKSTHIQEVTNNKTRLFLNDISQNKRVIIKQNFKRLGLSFEKLTFFEGQKLQSFVEYDKILIDAPCSGSGNYRRHPESRWNKEEDDIYELIKIQRAILERSKIYIKKGGFIVYSTCSIYDDENMEIVKEFIANNKDDYVIERSSNPFVKRFETKEGGYFVNPAIHGYEGAFSVCIKRIK